MPPPNRADATPCVSPAHAGRRYRLIAFIRIDPEDDEPLTYEQALAEKDQQELMSPENMYHIEEIKKEDEPCASSLK